MKKTFALFLAALLIMASAEASFAAATHASRARNASNSTPSITDASSGATVDVSTNGDLVVRARKKTIETRKATGTFSSQPINVYSITFTGSAANDQLDVFDGDGSAEAQTAKFEIEIGTARSSIHLWLGEGGAYFSDGLYVIMRGSGSNHCTILMDEDTV